MQRTILSAIILSILVLGAWTYSETIRPSASEQIIKFNDIPYDGSRVYVGPIKPSANGYDYHLINTGRRDVRLGGGYDKIVVNLDPSFHSIPQSEREKVVQEILSTKKFIKAGQMIQMNYSEGSDAIASKSSRPQRPADQKIDLGNGTTILESPEKENSERGKFLDMDNCPDLIIKDIEILKENKYHIAIEYTVKNQGTGDAELLGKKKSTDDNMVLKAYLSATPKFSRSAQAVGEAAIRKEAGKDGVVPRTREFKGKMFLNIRGRTNLTPYLILNLDPYQSVRECNERNNRSYVKLPS